METVTTEPSVVPDDFCLIVKSSIFQNSYLLSKLKPENNQLPIHRISSPSS